MHDLVFVEVTPLTGRIIPVASGITIGREGTDVLLPDPEVSRRHARVRLLDGAPAIEDLGSTNGTWVNERRTRSAIALREGDVLRLGHTVWHVRSPSAVTKVAETSEQA